MLIDAKPSNYPILENIDIPESVINNWQVTIDMLAKLTKVPTALIMRVHEDDIEVFINSHNKGNVYSKGEKAPLNFNLYCETVMNTQRELLVTNALKDPLWEKNPDIKLGMISYCGFPLTWPEGEIFGTICILDNKENAYSQLTHDLLERFRDLIQFNLKSIYDSAMDHISNARLSKQVQDEIANLKQAEESLKEKDRTNLNLLAKLNEAQRSALLGSWEWDLLTNLVWWSDETYRIFGVSSLDYIPSFEANGKFIHPDDFNKYQERFTHSLKTGEPLMMDIRIIGGDGLMRNCSTTGNVILDDTGKAHHFVGTVMDISERKMTEEALIQANNRLSLAQHSSGAGVWDWDMETGKLDWSPELFELFGLDPATIPTFEVWQNIMHPDDVQLAGDRIDKAIRDHIPLSNEYRIILPFGELHWINALGDTIYNEQGEPQRMSGICIDITERKQAEEKMREDKIELQRLLDLTERSRLALLSLIEDQKENNFKIVQLNETLEKRVAERTAQLEASNKELESFAYSISHDLRAPLRAIDGYSQILEQDYAGSFDQEGSHLLRIVRENTHYMDQLITDLLELSRVGRTELKFSSINMKDLVKSTYHEIATPEALEKFVFNVSNIPDVFADPVLIHHVWINLISNAIKYTMPKEKGKIEILGTKENGIATYSIKDNGVGFNPKYKTKLFELFQRLHKASDFEGSGVGLAIVKRIILRHGGNIWAEGQIGNGATFSFSIPDRQFPFE